MPLAGDHRRHREQCPGGRRSRREVGGVDAGLGDVDAVARQRVELQEDSSGPRARRDDRTRRPTAPRPPAPWCRHPSCPAPAACARARPAVGGPPPGPAPRAQARRRARRAGRPRRRGSRTASASAAHDARIGPRPRSGHFVYVHRPAGRGEAAAHPAVEGVAPARPRRVVDPFGNDHVHRGHSARS